MTEHDPLCTVILNSEMNWSFCDCEKIAEVKAYEREECATLIDDMLAGEDADEMSFDAREWAEEIAVRIRLRGQS